jgi:hypothetical protein
LLKLRHCGMLKRLGCNSPGLFFLPPIFYRF